MNLHETSNDQVGASLVTMYEIQNAIML